MYEPETKTVGFVGADFSEPVVAVAAFLAGPMLTAAPAESAQRESRAAIGIRRTCKMLGFRQLLYLPEAQRRLN